jgi:ferredoxin--NADP+ reductase/benzoate/toluate 1,2-dioxygenase reductase subunit
MDIKTVKESKVHALKAISVRDLTPSAYVLRFERNGIPFRAGQHILLGMKDDIQAREYSIYSGEKEDFFEVLIKEVQDGKVSRQLRHVNAGEVLNFENPVGYFIIKDEDIRTKKFLFIASGSGIAPFHSFVLTYPGLNYRILHGVRYAEEAYDRKDYDPARHVLCTTRDKKGNYHGRVTEWLKQNPVKEKDTLCYLCGNCEMIHEAYDILISQGIPSENLFAEVYF